VDDVARFNIDRWQTLVKANAPFTRPLLNLDAETARDRFDPEGLFGDLTGKDVLCLAGAGGQQSAAFAILGAQVTVFDLSEAQLERDREAAAHYQIPIQTAQGDMRDLSGFAPASFDLIYQPYSLGFVPDARIVFAEVARTLRPGGMYFFAMHNPFYCGLSEADWNGEGYSLKLPYTDGARVSMPDPEWVYSQSEESSVPANHGQRESQEYRQTLGKVMNSLIRLGFSLIHFSDARDFTGDPEAEPGTWDHFISIAPPWLAFWWRYEPV